MNTLRKGVRCVVKDRPIHRLSKCLDHLRFFSVEKPYISGDNTHFGFETVRASSKESLVKDVFSSVAESYDVMNDFMSMGIHRYWKDYLCEMTAVKSIASAVRRDTAHTTLSLLDVAGGTGDVAFRLVDACGCDERAKYHSGEDPVQITVCDINPSMLEVGERRARAKYSDAIVDHSKSLTFVEGNAECLPFEDNSFDMYTIAFGLRNVTDVDQALRDAHRVLKPGGRFLCLEFSHMPNPILQSAYDLYSFNVIPTLGNIVANDKKSYQYLVESIRKFCNQDELRERMHRVGFSSVDYVNLSYGIVAIHEGWKSK